MKFAWMMPVAAAGSLILGGCFQSEPASGPAQNELSYGAQTSVTWTKLPGSGKEVAASAAGRIWKIEIGSGNKSIWYYDMTAANPVWTQSVQVGSGMRIEVEDNGSPWVVNTAGDAWRGSAVGSGWTKYNTLSTGGTVIMFEIGAGGGQVWGLGGSYNYSDGGYQVFKLVNGKWELSSAARGYTITVDNAGRPWVINTTPNIYQFYNNAWVMRGTMGATFIGAGPDGQVWITVGSQKIYKWTGSAWDLCDPGLGIQIDRGNGFTVVANSQEQIWIGKP
jgi:hypothetical protein